MGCCECLENNQSLRVKNCSSAIMMHGPGVKCYIPCASTQILEKINLTAEQYLKVTYLTAQRDDDLIHHISGPCIFEQDDAYVILKK